MGLRMASPSTAFGNSPASGFQAHRSRLPALRLRKRHPGGDGPNPALSADRPYNRGSDRQADGRVPHGLTAAKSQRPNRTGAPSKRLSPYLLRVAAMTSLFPPWPLFSAFVLASLVLAVTPGPGVFYIVTRSIVQGRRAGLVSVAGVALGNFGNALAASVGLAALFAVSSLAFTIVKYAGAIYLVYLGVQMLRTPHAEPSAPAPAVAALGRIFRDGFVVALLNPKTTLFFAAFLPQFLSPAVSPVSQSMALGALFVAIAALTDSAYALAAGAVAPALARVDGVRRVGRRLGGSAFIGLGVFTALAGSRDIK
jgi:threonine/homoserine/homoserine lactone efflux protein